MAERKRLGRFGDKQPDRVVEGWPEDATDRFQAEIQATNEKSASEWVQVKGWTARAGGIEAERGGGGSTEEDLEEKKYKAWKDDFKRYQGRMAFNHREIGLVEQKIQELKATLAQPIGCDCQPRTQLWIQMWEATMISLMSRLTADLVLRCCG